MSQRRLSLSYIKYGNNDKLFGYGAECRSRLFAFSLKETKKKLHRYNWNYFHGISFVPIFVLVLPRRNTLKQFLLKKKKKRKSHLHADLLEKSSGCCVVVFFRIWSQCNIIFSFAGVNTQNKTTLHGKKNNFFSLEKSDEKKKIIKRFCSCGATLKVLSLTEWTVLKIGAPHTKRKIE